MADSFQLKAIITAVDKVSEPLKGMQRQLKGFKKEFASLSLGAAGAGSGMGRSLALFLACDVTSGCWRAVADMYGCL
ncbi:TPA: hypothetical protein KW043_001407 [Escherichia coli]|uniref:Phage tail tape measure protein n=1 Tax=Escherichia coli O141:H4 TaxID=2861806 RepID=A0ABD7FPG2_ECOLX|nr:hypothetical protein KZW89_10225 [Escherichia coli O141:H4]RJX87760.1 hypothetical protein D3821_23875 [Escherichia coli]HBH7738296.1 hypothetical protein [Escherichia coli]HBH7753712.1 hypothetical protein [Escherichia coli]